MNNRRITPDDLKPGMFVIVEEWLDETLAPSKEGDDRPFWMRNPQIRKPVGDPMLVLAVAIPFMTVQLCGQWDHRGVLDTRQLKLQKVGMDYVLSLFPDYGKSHGQSPATYRPPDQNSWKTIPEEPK